MPVLPDWILRILDEPITQLIAAITAALAYFLELGALPLDARFLIIGACLFIIYAGLLRQLWKWMARTSRTVWVPVASLLLTLGCCILGIVVLHLTCTYHNITFLMKSDPKDAHSTHLSFFPSRYPSKLRIELAVLQRNGARLGQHSTGDCGNADHLVDMNTEADGDFDAVYVLTNFVYPECFNVSLRVVGPPDLLRVLPRVEPTTTRLIWPSEYSSYHLKFYILGGLLCVFGLALLYWRWWSLLKKLP